MGNIFVKDSFPSDAIYYHDTDTDEAKDRTCRICFEHASTVDPEELTKYTRKRHVYVLLHSKDALVSVCGCKGSFKWVHRFCFDQWRITHFEHPKARACEICKRPYPILTLKPSLFQYVQEKWATGEKLFVFFAVIWLVMSLLIQPTTEQPARSAISRFISYATKPKKSHITICLSIILVVHGYLFEKWRTHRRVEFVLENHKTVI